VYDLLITAKTKFPGSRLVLSGVLRRKGVTWQRVGAANDRLEWVARSLGATFVTRTVGFEIWTSVGVDFTLTELERENMATCTPEFVKQTAKVGRC